MARRRAVAAAKTWPLAMCWTTCAPWRCRRLRTIRAVVAGARHPASAAPLVPQKAMSMSRPTWHPRQDRLRLRSRKWYKWRLGRGDGQET